MSIAVITDTDASLPDQIAEERGIIQVPITVHFGEEILKSNEDIKDAELVARIEREGKLPTTSAPAPGDFASAFQQAFQHGADEVICLTVSGEVSATYQAALAARDFMPEREITVVDTWSVSMGQGFMALRAAEMAAQGAGREEILQAVMDVRDRTYLFASLATLKFMAMSGRVGAISAEMAKMLNIKPILTIQNGKLDLLEKIRTRRKAWQRLVDLAGEGLSGREVEEIFVLHVAAEEEAQEFTLLLQSQLDMPEEIPLAELSPGLSVHTGPGLVGVALTAV